MKYTYKYLEDDWVKGYWTLIRNNLDKDFYYTVLSCNPNITR